MWNGSTVLPIDIIPQLVLLSKVPVSLHVIFECPLHVTAAELSESICQYWLYCVTLLAWSQCWLQLHRQDIGCLIWMFFEVGRHEVGSLDFDVNAIVEESWIPFDGEYSILSQFQYVTSCLHDLQFAPFDTPLAPS